MKVPRRTALRRVASLVVVMVVATLAVMGVTSTVAMAAGAMASATSYEATTEDGAKVSVGAPQGALPDGAALHVDPVTSDEDVQAVTDELDEAEVSYDGFAAFDVYFTDADGNEIEPTEAVSVRFELPEGSVPEGAEDLAVHHLAEAEDGTVSDVEAVADDADATEGTVAVQDDATVDAEFTVESFSWFTLTYKGGNGIQVNLVTEGGSALPGGEVDFSDLSGTYRPTDFGDKYIDDQWISIEKLAETWASKTEGYEFVGAYRNQQQTNKFNWIRYNTGYSNHGWRYSTSNSAPGNSSGSGELRQIYLVYREISDPDQTAVKITDNVSASGKLAASYDGASDVFYVWEKSADGTSNWQTIEQLKLNGDQYLYDDEDQHALNVALEVVNDTQDDGGSWYRVSAYESQDAYEGGEDALATSAAMQLDYYDELQNGDFELPDVEDLTAGDKSNYQYPVGTKDLVWKTTGSDQQVEIVNHNGASQSSDYKNPEGAQGGKQYAELNCQAAGALYQDVLTVPGTDLNWQLYHRGRNGNDTMYLVIAPTNEVDDITTQADLNDLIEKIEGNQGGYQKSDGYYLLEITDNNNSWHRYASGSSGRPAYEVPGGQYMTRFFFVAGNTASGNNTVGNLLDNVQFTTGLLPAEDGEANLTITKVVSGVSEAAMESYSVVVDVDGQKVTLGNFNPQQGGTYSATETVTVENIPGNGNKTVTVTENASTPGGYTATGSTVSVNNEEAQTGTSAQVTLQERGSGSVTFTNTYKAPEPVDLGHSKYVKYNGDDTYDLSLDVLGSIFSGPGEKIKINLLYVLDNSTSMDDRIGLWGSSTRLSALKDAVRAMETTLSNNGDLDVSRSAVVFSSARYSNTYVYRDWGNSSISIDNLRTTNHANGTNYQAGIEAAEEQLSKIDASRSDAMTVVVFVSDGEPNRYGNSDSSSGGTSRALNAAKEAIVDIQADRVYAVGVGGDVSVDTLQSLVNASTTATEKQAYGTSNSDELTNIFKDLASQLTQTDAKNVTISDKLSGYAELTDNATFALKVTNGEGEDVDVSPASVTREAASAEGGATASFRSGDKDVQVTIKYDDANKTFTVDFPDDYVLDNSWTYTVTTQIQPTEAAYNAGENGYNATGDQGTDAPGNSTSSDQRGFHSNDTATLTYESAGQTVTDDYPYPVIQVHPRFADLSITKKVEGPEGMNIPSAEFIVQVELKDENNKPITGSFDVEGIGESNAITFDSDGVAQFKISADQTVIIKNLSVGITYKVTEPEDSIPGAFELEYIVDREEYPGLDAREILPTQWEGEIDPKGNEIEILNGFKGYGLEIFKGEIAMDDDGNITSDEDGNAYADHQKPLSNAEFLVYQKLTDESGSTKEVTVGTMKTGEDGRAVLQTSDGYRQVITDGTYYIRETKVPSGYQLLSYEVELTIKGGQATFTTIEESPVTAVVELNENGNFYYEIANKPNPDLPSSGSNGTLLMMSTGVAVVLLAGAYLSKRFGRHRN